MRTDNVPSSKDRMMMTKIETLCIASLLTMTPLVAGCDGGNSGDEGEGEAETSMLTATTGSLDETGDTGDGDTGVDDTGDGDSDSGDGDSGDGDTGTGECGLPGLSDPGPVAAVAGQPVHHFEQLSHEGELLNLCQFAGQRVMVDLSAVWCPPCHDAADCVSGDDAACGELFSGGLTPQIQTMVDGIRANLVDGKVSWVTVLGQSAQQGVPATMADVENWASQYDQENVWVMLDDQGVNQTWLPTNGIPFFVTVNEAFTYESVNTGAEWGYMAN